MICMNLNCTSARNDTYLHHIGRAHKFALSPDQTRSGVRASTRARQPACACRRVSISSISSGAAAAVCVCVRALPDRATKSYFHDVSASAPIINYSLEPRGGSLSLRVHMHARATGKVLAPRASLAFMGAPDRIGVARPRLARCARTTRARTWPWSDKYNDHISISLMDRRTERVPTFNAAIYAQVVGASCFCCMCGQV